MNGKRLWPSVVAVALACVLGLLLVSACRQEPARLTAQGITNLDSLTLSQDLVVGDDATVGGDLSLTGPLSAGNGLRVGSNLTGTSASGVFRFATGYFTKTLDTRAISVTTGITCETLAVNGASVLTGNVNIPGILSSDTINILRLNENTLVTGTLGVSGKATLASADVTAALQGGSTALFNSGLTANAATITTTASVGGLATLSNGLQAAGGITSSGNILDNSGSASLTYNTGVFSSTLTANTMSAADAITAGGTLRSVGVAYLESGAVTSTLSANTIEATDAITAGAGVSAASLSVSGLATLSNGLKQTGAISISGSILDTSGSGTLTMSAGVFTSTVTANTLETTDAVTVGGTLTVNGGAVYSGGESFAVPVYAANGLRVGSNITGTDDSAVLTFGTGVFTSTLVANTVSATDAITAGGTLRSVGVAYLNSAQVTSTLSANSISTTDAITAGGTLRSVGVAYLQAGVVTSTLSANTLSVTDNITVSNDVTVTGWLGFGGTYMAVSSTVDYTDTETLIVVANKTIYPVTAGGPTATLDTTVSISDGFYLGQVIYICNVDTVGHDLVVKHNANTFLYGAADVTIGIGMGMTFWWDGTDWRMLDSG